MVFHLASVDRNGVSQTNAAEFLVSLVGDLDVLMSLDSCLKLSAAQLGRLLTLLTCFEGKYWTRRILCISPP
jgi:hypothetical protein